MANLARPAVVAPGAADVLIRTLALGLAAAVATAALGVTCFGPAVQIGALAVATGICPGLAGRSRSVR
jgi:hypothetical protein